jgi:hypothetical protein
MKAYDFEFDNRNLSEFGMIVCNFGDKGLDTVSDGAQITFHTISTLGGLKHELVSTEYEECLGTTFQICKHSCDKYNLGTMNIEEELVSQLYRWLNKKKYRKFKMLYSDGKCSDMFFKGTFPTINALVLNGEVVGLELTFQANVPFGYYEPLEFEMDFSDVTEEYCIYDTSDEEGEIYPSKLEITVLEDGDLKIYNSMEKKYTIIKNCKVGELITLDGSNKIIQSDMAHPTLYNDFNYTFIRIMNKSGENEDYYEASNEGDERENVFTVNLPCKFYLNTLLFLNKRKVFIL